MTSIFTLINRIAHIEYVRKETQLTRVTKDKSLALHKASAQVINNRLPIKKEVQPQFKSNYKPNTYLNTHYQNRSYR